MRLILNRAAIVLVAALGITVSPGSFPTYAQTAAGPLEKVRFADGAFLPSAPVYVALEKKYFKQEGLDISYLPFPTGREGLEAVINGKADFTTVADTPIVFQVMKGAKIYVLATLSSMGNLYAVVARRDRGSLRPGICRARRSGWPWAPTLISFWIIFYFFITYQETEFVCWTFRPKEWSRPSRLGISSEGFAGKKIGVALGTNAHFFLDNFLLFHNVSRNGVRLLKHSHRKNGRGPRER